MAAHTGYGLPFTILLCFISLFFNTKVAFNFSVVT